MDDVRVWSYLVSVGAVVASASCALPDEGQLYTATFFSMDTVVEYTVSGTGRTRARSAVADAQEEVERVAQLFWEGDESSEIYRINHSTGEFLVDVEVYSLLERTRAYEGITNGAFDVTLGGVLDLYSFEPGSVPPPDSVIQARLRHKAPSFAVLADSGRISRAPDSQSMLAVSGVAKGYAVDRAVAVLVRAGVTAGVVNAGGDLYCLGRRSDGPWRVGIRDPDDAEGIALVLHIEDAAVATSGDYQRYFDYDGIRYHHILDPRSGMPARRARSATVVASSTEYADALATAAFVSGAEAGIRLLDGLEGVEGMIIDSVGVVHESARFGRFVADPPPSNRDYEVRS